MSAQETVLNLIAALRESLKLEVRKGPPEAGRLEAVMHRRDVEAACALLAQTLGPPVKPFGAAPKFDAPMSALVNAVGGIETEQCLYLKPDGPKHAMYAALWPWKSDPDRVTLHVGVSTHIA